MPRWSASSLRHSPPDCAAELVLRTQPSRLCAQGEGTTSETSTTEQQQSPNPQTTTRQKAQKTMKLATTTKKTRPRSPKGSQKTRPRSPKGPEHTRRKTEPQDPASRAPFYLPGFNASLLPVFGSASLRASSRSFERRGISQFPAPHSSKRPIASDLPRPSPHTKRGEKEAGKIRAPRRPSLTFVFAHN